MAVWSLELLAELSSTDDECIALARCGDERLDALLRSCDPTLEDALHNAHRRMAASDSETDRWTWRRYYTDASLVLALSKLAASDTQKAKAAISRLDHAIVIAGAAGRLELFYTLIRRIQDLYLPQIYHPDPSVFALDAPSTPLPASASVPILELSEAPSLHFFRAQLSARPFLLRHALADWPALTKRPWSSPTYLRSVSGPGRVVPVEIGSDYRTEDWKTEMMDWDAFLDALSDTDTSPALYLAQHNLFLQFPALCDDILIPDYAYAAPSAPSAPSYQPPPTADQLLLNAWLGPAHTLSPAHTDPYFNLYAQVVGYKSVWLAPPSATPYMERAGPSISNTSRVDVFRDGPTDSAFWTHVPPLAMHARLGPGDLLFFPPGWWHAMRSDSTSFSVSMWF